MIRGMMAGYSERILRRAAQDLHVRYSYGQAGAAHPGVFVERWQIPPSQR